MTMTMRNGTPQRKQLSDQLDRLDGIIDCLADGLTDRLAQPVKGAVAIHSGRRQRIRQARTFWILRPAIKTLPPTIFHDRERFT